MFAKRFLAVSKALVEVQRLDLSIESALHILHCQTTATRVLGDNDVEEMLVRVLVEDAKVFRPKPGVDEFTVEFGRWIAVYLVNHRSFGVVFVGFAVKAILGR